MNLRTSIVTASVSLISILMLTGCATVPRSTIEWDKASRQNSAEYYEKYIADWPESKYVLKAKERLAAIYVEQHWDEAAASDTREGYEEFLRQHPVSKHSIEAFTRLRGPLVAEHELEVESDWNEAQKKGDIAAFENFLVNNPGSSFSSEARRRLEPLGSSPMLERSLEENSSTIERQREKSDCQLFAPVVIFPFFSDSNTTRMFFKNNEYDYVQIVKDQSRVMPSGFELLTLRHIPPFGAVILSISSAPGDSISWKTDLASGLTQFLEIFASDSGINKYDLDLIMFPADEQSWPSPRVKDFYENIKLAARSGNDYRAVLEVNEPWSLARYASVQRLTRDLEQFLQSGTGSGSKQSVELLMMIDTPDARQAIKNGGETAARALVVLAEGSDDNLRAEAKNLLVDMGASSVPSLIAKLERTKEEKEIWISLLEQIGDHRAAPCLVKLCIEWEVGPRAASALESMGWTPSTVTEKVYFAAAKRDRKPLVENWDRARAILLTEFESGNEQGSYGALRALIAAGKNDVTNRLMEIMKADPTRARLELFLNCGNIWLEGAAIKFAEENGYKVEYKKGIHAKATWGKY